MESRRPQFVKWLEQRVQAAGGLRPAAEKAGVSHATLLRGLQGDPLSLKTLEGISKWTGVGLTRLLSLYGEHIEDDQHVEAALARVLDQYPQLRGALEMAVKTLDDESIAQVIQFIQFQIERKKK